METLPEEQEGAPGPTEIVSSGDECEVVDVATSNESGGCEDDTWPSEEEEQGEGEGKEGREGAVWDGGRQRGRV